MGKDSILRLKNTILFKKLIEKEKEEFDDSHLSSKVVKIVEYVAPLLARIPENMSEYTLHDANHSAKVVENMGKILPLEVLGNLNSIEITLLILSGYLHDIGMTCSKEEKEEIIKGNNEFKVLFKSDITKFEKYNGYKENGEHRLATFIEDQVFTEYLRRNHVERSANFIARELNDGELTLECNDIPFWKHLVKICDGHGEPVKSLYDLDKWPRHTLIGQTVINVQYLSLILRLADILDLDPERTPKVIYEFINPKDPVSILEWRKHRSIIGNSITSKKILFEAECTNAEVERALKEFMYWIEIERSETMKLLSKYNDEISKNYFLELNEIVAIDRIKSDGSYISSDLKFEIDYQRVMELLMGQRLYKNPVLTLRELLQNSIDAIKIRQELYSTKYESFEPLIKIIIEDEELIIIDNGVGMDEDVFKNYFLQVGKSFYSSPTFYGRFSEVDVTSEFGIGILSTFMIANSIIVESRKEPEDTLNPFKPILFEIPTAYSYLVRKESQMTDIGTKITLKLKNKELFKKYPIKEVLEQLIPSPPVNVEVFYYQEKFIHSPKINTQTLKELDFDLIKNDNAFMESLRKLRRWAEKEIMINDFKLIEIDFDSEDCCKHIEGKLILKSTMRDEYNFGYQGKLTQRNFTVGYPIMYKKTFSIESNEEVKNLFPCWCSFSGEVNLTKSASLSITPDRTNLILDEKYEKIKKSIELLVIESIKIHLKKMRSLLTDKDYFLYLDLLIYMKFINEDLYYDDKLTDTSIDFLSTILTLPTLGPDGKPKRLSYKEIARCKNVAILSESLTQIDVMKITQLSVKHDITFILLKEFNFPFWESYIRNSFFTLCTKKEIQKDITCGYLTSELPKFIITYLKFEGKYGQIKEIDFVDFITENNHSRAKILFIDDGKLRKPKLNASHKAFYFLFKNGNYKNHMSRKLIKTLRDRIHNVIYDSCKSLMISDIGLSNESIKKQLIRLENQQKYLKGIFTNDPSLLIDICSIFESYWNDCLDNKIISSKRKKPVITKEDFPSYWH